MSYIHSGKVGVLMEVNCRTDFVPKQEAFKQLVEDLAMQLTGFDQINYISVDQIPEEILERER